MTGPATIDPAYFRQVLGHLPTGVAVITADGEDGPAGMAVNSLTSVSLDPPLVLFCPARTSTTWPLLRQAGTFCVNVMAGHHEALCRRFAARDGDRFAGVEYRSTPTGPALSDAVAWLECALEAEHAAGDHEIVVARVLAVEAAAPAVDPLVFFRGTYGSFLPG